jgi:hypothetical protein
MITLSYVREKCCLNRAFLVFVYAVIELLIKEIGNIWALRRFVEKTIKVWKVGADDDGERDLDMTYDDRYDQIRPGHILMDPKSRKGLCFVNCLMTLFNVPEDYKGFIKNFFSF